MNVHAQEGVIKFDAQHEYTRLSWDGEGSRVASLFAWREVFRGLGLLGQEPGRYEGLGFGNLSARLPSRTRAAGHRRFLITCTQTSGAEVMDPEQLCVIERYELQAHRVVSRGPCLPSSESMTHAALYDADSELGFVFHVHAPAIWGAADALGLPCTAERVEYGTPAMALEVRRVYRGGAGRKGQVIVMRGHEDGVLAFGATAQEAGSALVTTLTAALAAEIRRRFP